MGNERRRLESPRLPDTPPSTSGTAAHPARAHPARARAAGGRAKAPGLRTVCGLLAACGLPAACGLLAGPREGIEIVVAGAHFPAPAPVRFEVRNHGPRDLITVACDGVPRVYVLRRGNGGWHNIHDSCPVDEGSFLDIGAGEVLRGSLDNQFPPGLYVLRLEFRLGREQVFPRTTRSKGFQITR